MDNMAKNLLLYAVFKNIHEKTFLLKKTTIKPKRKK